jgi:hypothetical protein
MGPPSQRRRAAPAARGTGCARSAHRRRIVIRPAPPRCLTDRMQTEGHPGVRATCGIAGATLVLLAAAGCGPVGGTSGSGSCAMKVIELADPHLTPGGQVRLSVDWMTERCEDTGGRDRPASEAQVTITPESTGRTVALGVLDAASGPLLTASGSVTLPEDLPTGDATLVVASPTGERTTATLEVRITAD